MIFVGNDIVEIDRIQKIFIKFDNHFLKKIFSDAEIKNVINKKNKIIQYLFFAEKQ